MGDSIESEVGFIKGQQVAMQRELKEIKDSIKESAQVVTTRLNSQDSKLASMDGKLDGLLVAMKSTDKHPITKVTTQIETEGQPTVSTSNFARVLRHPSLPWVVCMACILSMALLCFAALTGRKASEFLPARAATPANP